MQQTIESTEQFIVATIDVALAAQNATIAAESLGLGCCFLGSLRNDIKRVDNLLELPDYVVPLFGLAVGYPDHHPNLKPRLPLESIYHENKYFNYDKQKNKIEEFNNLLMNYYQTRESNPKNDTWTEQMIRKYKVPRRMEVTHFVESKKLNKR